MNNNNQVPLHSNNEKERQEIVSFNVTDKKSVQVINEERYRLEKERKKLEELIEKRIEQADKRERKQKLKREKYEKKKNRENRESFITKIKKKIDEYNKNKEELRLKKEQEKIKRKEEKNNNSKLNNDVSSEFYEKKENDERKILKEQKELENERIKQEKELLNNKRREEISKSKIEKEERKKLLREQKEQLKKQEKEKREAEHKRKLEEKEKLELERKKEKEAKEKERLQETKEKEEKKRLIQEEKEQKRREKELEKEKIRQEQELLNIKNKEEISKSKIEKEERKKLLREQKEQLKKQEKEKKEAERQKKDEERKQRLKEKYEEELRRKKLREEKSLNIIAERREKAKKIKQEQEQARKERKEKALLIKKAQEESKEKARKERKTFKEKINDWYNNLSYVKDIKNKREMQRQTLLIDFEGADAVRSEEKVMYKYVAKNNETGKVETGMFAAFSKLDVHSFLLAEGYEVYEITPQKNINKPISLSSSKFNASELDFFLTQLSTFLKSGITLVDSVKILSKQSKKRAHKNVYKSVIYELTMGENFSEALAKQGNIFPRLLINMVKTSELTGDLPETLDDMADYYRETEKTKKQMISAITYPAVVLCFAVVILIFIMVQVIPQFVSIYNNMDSNLPGITLAVINLSNFLQANWILLIIGIIAFIIVFIVLFKSIKVFKSVIQSIIMNVPVFGKIVIYNEVTMFTKTFASLLNHNVYITDCMEVLSKITNNEIYKMLIFDTITNLAKGEAISNSFKNHWAFPTIAYEMILTGEKTGQLGNMMDKVADYYQEQHKNAVNQIKAFIEPIMIIVLATIVGVVLLSVVLPMFDMYQNIG